MASLLKESNVLEREITEMNQNKPAQAQTPISCLAESNPNDYSVWQAIKKNPVIVLYCFYANLGAFMYGFDNITLSLCLDMAPFVQQFGELVDGAYIVPTYWQSLWNAVPQLTTGFGAWASGPVSDRFGRRWTMLISGAISVVGVSIIFTAETNGQFLGGKMVNALGLGMALTAGQTYISEVAPLKLRGIAIALYTLCLNLGYLTAASISFTRITIMDNSSYKVMFATEWCCPVVIILGAFLIPESPYYLIRKSRIEAARKSLSRLYHESDHQVQSMLRYIQQILAHEMDTGNSTFSECFKGTNWRRTRIVLYANGLAQMVGAVFLNNAPYFMVLAGLSETEVAMIIELGIGLSIISAVFTYLGMVFLGRRSLVLGGIGFAGTLFFIMGIAATVPAQGSSTRWCVAITLQMAWLSIGPSIGPALAVAGEVSTMRLRAKTLAIGFFFNFFYSTAWNIAVPYMFNNDEGNLGGLTGWVFFATCLVSFVIMWFEFPDTKDLTASQIDERFEMKVNTRAFRKYQDDLSASDGELKKESIEFGGT